MRYSKLGHSDLKVSMLGLGTLELGGEYGAIDEGEAVKAIFRGLELGVNFIDLAPIYGLGHAEDVVG